MPSTDPIELTAHAERAVLGTCILYPDRWDTVVASIQAEAFEAYRTVFRTIERIQRRGEAFDIPMLASEGMDPSMLAGLTSDASPSNLESYINQVRRGAMRRDAIDVLNETLRAARDNDQPIEDVLPEGIEALQQCFSSRSDAVHISEPIKEWAEDTAARVNNPEEGAVLGVPTGLEAINGRLTFGGVATGHLTVIGGQSGGGKTAFAISGLVTPAAIGGSGVLLCSLEDSAVSVACRAIADIGNLSNKQLQRRDVSSAREFGEACAAGKRLAGTELYVIDTPPNSVDSLCAQIVRHCREIPTALVVIDFAQYVQSGLSRGNSTAQEDHVVKTIALMARRLKDTATVLLSQLRAIGDGDEPTANDLRGSKSMRHFAHTIAILWDNPDHKDTSNPVVKTLCVLKQKQGPVGNITIGFEPTRQRFCDV